MKGSHIGYGTVILLLDEDEGLGVVLWSPGVLCTFRTVSWTLQYYLCVSDFEYIAFFFQPFTIRVYLLPVDIALAFFAEVLSTPSTVNSVVH